MVKECKLTGVMMYKNLEEIEGKLLEYLEEIKNELLEYLQKQGDSRKSALLTERIEIYLDGIKTKFNQIQDICDKKQEKLEDLLVQNKTLSLRLEKIEGITKKLVILENEVCDACNQCKRTYSEREFKCRKPEMIKTREIFYSGIKAERDEWYKYWNQYYHVPAHILHLSEQSQYIGKKIGAEETLQKLEQYINEQLAYTDNAEVLGDIISNKIQELRGE